MYRMFRDARAFNQDIGSMGYLERHDHDEMFYSHAFNQHLSRWDVSSVTTMQEMFYDANAFNTMPVGWDTSKVTDSYRYFILQTHGMRGSRAATTTPSPMRVDAQGQRVRRVLPPLNGAVGTCTDTLVSGTSCVPTCDPGYVLEGVTSCTDRVLTEAVCTLDVTTRAELKAAVDACVGDRLCEMTMPHWDVSRVTDMSFLFQGKTQFNVDISQWEMSQVTDARVCSRAPPASTGHHRVDLRRRTRTRRGCSRAPTPGSRSLSRRRARHDGWTAGRMGPTPCLGERTRRERSVRALHRRRDQTPREMIPHSVSTPGARFPTVLR